MVFPHGAISNGLNRQRRALRILLNLIRRHLATELVREINRFRDKHRIQRALRRRRKVDIAEERLNPVLLGTGIRLTVAADIVPAVPSRAEVDLGTQVEEAGVAEETEGREADTAFVADQIRALEGVEVDGPGFDDVEREVPFEANQPEPQLLDIILRDLASTGVHVRLLVGLAADK